MNDSDNFLELVLQEIDNLSHKHHTKSYHIILSNHRVRVHSKFHKTGPSELGFFFCSRPRYLCVRVRTNPFEPVGPYKRQISTMRDLKLLYSQVN